MMKRLLRLFGIVLLVAVQIVAVCYLVDFFFRRYEKNHVYSYATRGAPSFSLEAMLLNDVHGQVAAQKPGKEYRILVFGDSFTYAVTRPEYGFCAVLEQRLNALGLDRPVRVVNLGFPSISFPEYLERFYFWNQALDYDAVIFNVYAGNDFNDVRKTPYDPKALAETLARVCSHGLAFGPYTLLPHQYPFRFLDFVKAQALFRLQSDKSLRKLLGLPDLDSLGVLPDKADQRYRSLLPLSPDQMASEMRSHLKPYFKDTMFAYENALPWYQLFLATAARVAQSGKPVLVMVSPPLCAVSPAVGAEAAKALGQDPAKLDKGLPGRVTRELAASVGLPDDDILDLTPCLAETTPDGHGTYSGRDTHWSPEGNAWVADILAGQLAARWFGRPGDAACQAVQTPAREPVPAGRLLPVAAAKAMADAVVAGCPAQ
ncbi:hypothetical protein DFW101_1383 [Solidesulfovibrio carbinoliphilus subsp. oakridgensis]|uniref:AlgX/AlgJ SGNH hydrolase-like domain-containing protein n=1 Tax=Solidesulfovibrio carbinoliphilus subsp. oakridgensis TaxID=694327 RepID=G7Q7T3_9BACT|nr:SGNH/GDSL hydrolase family protein [Solidesulfovibrio carbinoliphilus]EHJ47392.1 hypothetical protein DFW101_1383 [Solidesulfovibrio carbinoliphilus subsp. oakridgensis]